MKINKITIGAFTVISLLFSVNAFAAPKLKVQKTPVPIEVEESVDDASSGDSSFYSKSTGGSSVPTVKNYESDSSDDLQEEVVSPESENSRPSLWDNSKGGSAVEVSGSSFYDTPQGGSPMVGRVITTSDKVFQIINYILGLLGLISMIAIPFCFIYAIVLLVKKEKVKGYFDKRSGMGDDSVVPAEIKKWNWGAAVVPFIWGPYFGVWISLLTFVPFVNMIWWIVLGIKGNEWAWRKMRWESVEKFNETQKKWNKWGLIILIAPTVFFAVFSVIGLFIS